MTTTKPASIEKIGHVFARKVKSDLSVRRLYGRQFQDVAELWFVTASIDMDHELQIYRLAAELDREFPTALIEFHLVNPAHFDPFHLEWIVPTDDPDVKILFER